MIVPYTAKLSNSHLCIGLAEEGVLGLVAQHAAAQRRASAGSTPSSHSVPIQVPMPSSATRAAQARVPPVQGRARMPPRTDAPIAAHGNVAGPSVSSPQRSSPLGHSVAQPRRQPASSVPPADFPASEPAAVPSAPLQVCATLMHMGKSSYQPAIHTSFMCFFLT